MILQGNTSRILSNLFVCCLFACIHVPQDVCGQDRYVYANSPIREVIEDLEHRSGFRFLYRDAIITGKTLSLDSDSSDLISALEAELLTQHIQMRYDAAHRQILLSNGGPYSPTRSVVLTGYVLDNQTGTRLPFANVTWQTDGYLQGVTSNESGFFQAQVEQIHNEDQDLTLSVSYVGYYPERVVINYDNLPSELSIRLKPATIQGREVLVSSSMLSTDIDTTWHHLLDPALFSPLGESSVIRSLNALPAVALSTALSDGLNVRGSKADGFQVLLDGAPIYNQNHFFGLFDAFNADALQTVGFYYDIAPASYFAPPGGTISFITRSGSLNKIRTNVAASNSSLRATIEGPLAPGRASWLVSARHSYLNNINWFNNHQIIGIGLETDLDISELPINEASVEDFLLDPISSEALFFDVHGKVSAETRQGSRATLSFYIGQNDTELSANRLTLQRNQATNRLQPGESEAFTQNKWGNEAVSLQFHHRLGDRSFLQSTLAASHYLSRYSKDDFVYTRILRRNGQPRNYVFPFSYENELLDLKFGHHLTIIPGHQSLWSLGASANYYAIQYNEQSANRSTFGEDYFALEVDTYGEYERRSNYLDVRLGLRGIYFSQGATLRLSPRFQMTVLPKARASLRFGYSRNYQFLHQLHLENTNSASIWIITTGAQDPSTMDNLTAGLYIKATPTAFFQIEGYRRQQTNLRKHELNAPTQITTANEIRFTPWFSENEARAQGLEFMYRQRIRDILWTNGYTLSQVELKNDVDFGGEWYPAEWDRTHQFTTHFMFSFTSWLSTQITWFYASGNPDVLVYNNGSIPTDRLPDYHRMDASIQMKLATHGSLWKFTLSAYNLYGNKNTWYRERIQVFNPVRPGLGTSFVNVDVFDLGFQPSFDLSVTF